jgi:hypothetical protein
MKPEIVRAVFTFFVAISIIVGPIMTIGSGVSFTRSVQTEFWPRVSATVVSFDDGGPPKGASGPDYRPQILYKYRVNGEDHLAQNVAEEGDAATVDAGRLADLKARYQPGSTVDAYVSPDNPAQSFLEHSPTFSYFSSLVAGLCWTVFGAGGIVYLLSPNTIRRFFIRDELR